MMWILSLEFDVMSSMFRVLEMLLESRKWQSFGASRMNPKSPLHVEYGHVFIGKLFRLKLPSHESYMTHDES